MKTAEVVANVLEHHGVKGMKWGIRRDRSAAAVTATGRTNRRGRTRIKVKGGQGHPAHNDAIAAKIVAQKLKKSGSDTLSNEELKTLATRLNLERQIGISRSGNKIEKVSRGANYAQKFLNSPEGQTTMKKIRNKAAATAAAAAIA